MSKKIAQIAVAGGILVNALSGTTLVSAHSGETDYPENIVGPLVITEVDVRNNSVSAFFRDENNLESEFKGIGVFEGEISDDELNSAYPGVDTGVMKYVEYNLWTENWEETGVGVERTYGIDGNLLTKNASGALSFYYLFSSNTDDSSLNINRGRMNYRECLDSAEYRGNKEAICRAELWSDGWLRYRPYVRWKRFADFGTNKGEEGDYFVYRDNIWLNGRIVEDMERVSGDNGWIEDDGGEIGGGADDSSEIVGDGSEVTSDGSETMGDGSVVIGDGSETVSSDSEVVGDGESKPRIEYVEKIIEVAKEVSVEKLIEVVKEVPIEKIVEITKEVPIEKVVEVITTVPVKEIKEIPVEKIKEVTREVAVAGKMEEGSKDMQVDEPEKEVETLLSAEPTNKEEIEVPMLGRETDSSLPERIMTFAAGLVSALAVLGLVLAFKRKGMKISLDQ